MGICDPMRSLAISMVLTMYYKQFWISIYILMQLFIESKKLSVIKHTEKLRAVDWSTIQFWNFLAKVNCT